MQKYIVGLTGGIASGKGQVSRVFIKVGIPVINLDEVSKNLDSKELTEDLEKICGQHLKTNEGKLDRRKVREILFRNPQLKKQFEAYLHPLIWKSCTEWISMRTERLLIVEAPLLIESGNYKKFQELITVICDPKVQRQRLISRDTISDELADNMIASQTTNEERKKLATHLIDNSGTLNELDEKTTKIIQNWKAKGLI